MINQDNAPGPLQTLLMQIKREGEAQNRRMVRIESRLTQLMVFSGMQTDGRNPLINKVGVANVE